MKGMAGLVMEMLDAATRLDVVDQVIPGICKTMDGCSFEETMDRLTVGMAIHGARRAAELKGCVQMLNSFGLDSGVTEATVRKHEQIAAMNLKERFLEKAPTTWREVLAEVRKLDI